MLSHESIDELREVLIDEPQLTTYGFGRYDDQRYVDRNLGSVDDRVSEFIARANDAGDPWEICGELMQSFKPSHSPRFTSVVWKHRAERLSRELNDPLYVPEGLFLARCLFDGVTIARLHRDPSAFVGLSCRFADVPANRKRLLKTII